MPSVSVSYGLDDEEFIEWMTSNADNLSAAVRRVAKEEKNRPTNAHVVMEIRRLSEKLDRVITILTSSGISVSSEDPIKEVVDASQEALDHLRSLGNRFASEDAS
jgi:Zn-dependent oligopeptidase